MCKLKILVPASIFGAVAMWNGAHADQSRLTSKVLEYIHVSKDESQHKVVQRIIYNSFEHIKAELGTSSQDLDYLDGLDVSERAGTPILSARVLEELWADTKEPPIQILHGEIEPDENSKNSLIVHSSIYIGDLPELSGVEYKNHLFRIFSTTKLIDYGIIPSRHSYILTYALILEALSNKRPVHVIYALINSADIIYSRLEKDGRTTGEVGKIKESIANIASMI